MSFCIKCGNELHLKHLDNEGMIPFCDKCGEYRFEQFNVAVSMVILNKDKEKNNYFSIIIFSPGTINFSLFNFKNSLGVNSNFINISSNVSSGSTIYIFLSLKTNS